MVAEPLHLGAVILVAAARLDAGRTRLGMARGALLSRRTLLAGGRCCNGGLAADLGTGRTITTAAAARRSGILLAGGALDPDRTRRGFGFRTRAALGAAATTLAATTATFVAPTTAGGAVFTRGSGRQVVETATFFPGDRLADQLLDRRNELLVMARDDGEGGAEAPGAAGTADAVDIIFGIVG